MKKILHANAISVLKAEYLLALLWNNKSGFKIYFLDIQKI